MKFPHTLRSDKAGLAIYVSAAALAALVPSTVLTLAANHVLEKSNVDASSWIPSFQPLTIFQFLFRTAIGPLIETGIVLLIIKAVSRFTKSPVVASIVVAILCGAAHGLAAPLWFIGTVWSFFVYSYGFFLWRHHSLKYAILAMYLPHALLNSVVVTWIRLFPA